MDFRTEYIPESDLLFGNRQEEKDPRLGLKYFGPLNYSGGDIKEKIGLGIVGDVYTIQKTRRLIEQISKPIESLEPNKWLYPPFPGISKRTAFKCSIVLSETWEEKILKSEVDNILQIVDVNERIGSAVELYLQKINNIVIEDNPPDVIICCIPKEIEEYCGISEKTRGAKVQKVTSLERKIDNMKKRNQSFLSEWGIVVKEDKEPFKGYDFRNSLKGRVMSLKPAVPLQLLRESTLDYILDFDSSKVKLRQDPSSFAWNFSTALFYKANGKPWRLAKLRQDSCYVGVSFYRDKLGVDRDIHTSMAQVFTHNGEGLVLRGEDVYLDEKSKEPHLTSKQAYKLMQDSLARYIEKARRTPSRVVVHKKTIFVESELEGFNKAIDELGIHNIIRDFVSVSKGKRIRFMRKGSYPVLRGTLISLTEKEHLLYTSGYIPRIRTYPGHSVPEPLYLIHEGDSGIIEICTEILGLTKLNWNTTSFATYLPITLEFSEKVGQVLSELDKNLEVQNHYRFYM